MPESNGEDRPISGPSSAPDRVASRGRWAGLAIAALIGLAAAQPLFVGLLPKGADILLHYHRIAALSDMLARGYFYPRWFPFLAGGYGYPILLYYAPLAHYLGAAFHALGAGAVTATLLVFGLAQILAATGAYAWARERVGGAGALAAAAAYAFAPYILVDLMSRSALAELLALAIAPWAFWALTRLQKDGRPIHGLIAALSYAAVALCHNITALVFSPFLAAWGLGVALSYGGRSWLRDTVRAASVLALGLGASAFFWLPAFVERDLSGLDRALSAAYDFRTAFLPVSQLVAWPVPFDWRLVNDDAPYGLGALAAGLAVGGFGWLATRARRAEPERQVWLVWMGFLGGAAALGALMTLSASEPLWEAIPLLRFVLYPSRFLGIASLFLAILAGAGAEALAVATGQMFQRLRLSRAWGRAGMVALLIGGLIVYGFSWQFARRFEPSPVTGGAAIAEAERRLGIVGTTSIGEYLPLAVEAFPAVDAPTLAAGGIIPLRAGLPAAVRIRAEEISPLRYAGVISAVADTEITFSQFSFAGWVATVDGAPVPIAANRPNGLIRISVPAGEHPVVVAFGSTPVRDLADTIALVSVIAGGLGFGLALVRRRQTGRHDGVSAKEFVDWRVISLTALTVASLTAWKSLALDNSENAFRSTRLTAPVTVAGAMPVNANFGGAMELIAADPPIVSPGRERVTVDLFWRALKTGLPDYAVFSQLIGADGSVIAGLDTLHPDGVYPTSRWGLGEYARDRRIMSIPATAPPGVYVLKAGLYPNTDSGQRVPVLDANGQSIGGSLDASLARALTVTLGRPTTVASPGLLKPLKPLSIDLSPAIELLGMDLDVAQARPGQTLAIPLYWHAKATPGGDATACVDAVSSTAIVTLGCQPPVAGLPLSQWRAGDLWRSAVKVRIPAGIPGGTYTLRMRLGDNVPQPLFDLAIAAREHRTAPPGAMRAAPAPATLGGFAEAAGVLISGSARPGQTVTTTVVWRAAASADQDLTAFIQLWDAKGERKAGHDGAPCAGGCPTAGWLAGEYLLDAHRLDLPADLPAGDYRIVAGMYEPERLRRLTTGGGSDVVELGTLRVEP